MSSPVSVNQALIITSIIAAVFAIGYSFVLGTIIRNRYSVGWKYFWFGVLVFLVSQLLTRIPIIILLQDTVFSTWLHTSTLFTWIWLVIEAVTAGLFEEVGRYLGYRLFMRQEDRVWSNAVMFGVGHEGLESAILVGGQILLILFTLTVLSVTVPHLPVARQQTALQQIASINAQPVWLPLLAMWERFWSFPLQVALSVLVLQVFRRCQMYWLYLAILFHAVIDFLAAALPLAFGAGAMMNLLVAGMLCVFGIIALAVIWRLREPELQARPDVI